MLPKAHILLGVIFSLTLFMIFPKIGLSGYLLIFSASFLFDFDHYLVYVIKFKNISLSKAYQWHMKEQKRELALHEKGIRNKGHFHIFHTAEFHLVILALAFFYPFFFYLFIGVLFHSLVDIFDLYRRDMIYRREFFLTHRLVRKA